MTDQEDTLKAICSEGVDPGMFWELVGRRMFGSWAAGLHMYLWMSDGPRGRPLDKRQRRRAKRRAAREARDETR